MVFDYSRETGRKKGRKGRERRSRVTRCSPGSVPGGINAHVEIDTAAKRRSFRNLCAIASVIRHLRISRESRYTSARPTSTPVKTRALCGERRGGRPGGYGMRLLLHGENGAVSESRDCATENGFALCVCTFFHP